MHRVSSCKVFSVDVDHRRLYTVDVHIMPPLNNASLHEIIVWFRLDKISSTNDNSIHSSRHTSPSRKNAKNCSLFRCQSEVSHPLCSFTPFFLTHAVSRGPRGSKEHETVGDSSLRALRQRGKIWTSTIRHPASFI
jgi:hypothetical protein